MKGSEDEGLPVASIVVVALSVLVAMVLLPASQVLASSGAGGDSWVAGNRPDDGVSSA